MADRDIGSDRLRRNWSASEVQEALVISGEIPLWLVDGDDRIAFVNDAAVRTLGYDSDGELLGRPSHETVHWKHPDGSPYPAEDCPITHATRRGEPVRMERDWWVRKDGSMVPISIHCVQMEIDGRMGTAMTFHDLTASVQAEDEHRRHEIARARLVEVSASRARIAAAADETRKQIERDLHDGIQQSLVSLGLELRATMATVPPQLGELEGELSRIVERLTGALDEVRKIAHGIHPAILTEGGLEPALKVLARRSAVPVELDLRAERRLPPPIEVAAYYVASEAFTNAAKHSQASAVHVELDTRGAILQLAIRDDGIGGADAAQGSGLVGLSDRIEAVGGTFTLSSQPGDGTDIRVAIPLTGTPTLVEENVREGERVDVHEPTIGELEMRDHG
jgi:PAS domain S-box-containing protein